MFIFLISLFGKKIFDDYRLVYKFPGRKYSSVDTLKGVKLIFFKTVLIQIEKN